MSKFIPAATVVVLRQRDGVLETLLLQRNQALNFAAGAWVFPGGKVDPVDQVVEGELEQARLAAVRECQEEAALVLTPSQLTAFAHWTAPEGSTKRFTTWFFVAVVGCEEVVIDDSEITDYRWLPAEQALAQHRAGDLPMLPPTYICLSQIATHQQAHTFLAQLGERGVRRYQPRLAIDQQRLGFLYHEDAGYQSLDLFAPGRQHRCWMVDGICDYIDG
ncbi:8-oxo-dGTP pyrophosphatase MutT (NUDIX family) [Sinobacterium caligoides]|uniref:8-oxo-dGTP pyrophosphatase MutT (NUDIX family) n=1 Tax=Sinobacterium caligoides TaxID=933926 RepID=A0A3N2E0X2_9GAMM|nr:NUDIX hydrolase [Sinobacterium caligoides]ROS05760.1 8-oxo-dGTP pyrophosphatase MutT (NUDIX family) [Sinobacterium caligoides]